MVTVIARERSLSRASSRVGRIPCTYVRELNKALANAAEAILLSSKERANSKLIRSLYMPTPGKTSIRADMLQ